MAEQVQETVLNSIADNLADNFFDGGASSNNIITPEEKPAVTDDKKEKKEKKPELDSFIDNNQFSAATLFGDMIDNEPEKDQAVPKLTNTEVKEVKTAENSFNFIVEDGILAGFEDDAPITSKDDLKKLIEANKVHWEQEASKKAIEEDRSDLPEELKYLLEYTKNGGGDLKTIFKLLAESQEFKEYDVEKTDDQKALVRSYYQMQNWTDDEIEEEIINLVEGKRLQASAERLKPKLDKINSDHLLQRKEQEKEIKAQRDQARQFFEGNVMKTLKDGKIGDLKLSKDEQSDLYKALVTEKYQSLNGSTNRLGALLDYIQYVEPNYEHLMEVTMLLSDRDGFKKKLRDQMSTEVTASQVKKIKTDQQNQKIGGSHNPEKESKKLPRLGQGFINPL